MGTETAYQPTTAFGADMNYNERLSVKGTISPDQLKRFIKTRRKSGLGPTTVYYAGVVAPAISAGAYALFDGTFSQLNIAPLTLQLLVALCSATAGLTWFLIFTRLAERKSSSRAMELVEENEIEISQKGLIVQKSDIKIDIAWSAVMDIRTTKHYIAFIVEGTQDVFIPIDWYESREHMADFAEKAAALRPPPIAK